MSRLHWQILPAVVAGAKCSFNIRDRFFINAALGAAINRKTGTMTDHDWISDYFSQVSTGWTHESVSRIFLTSSLLLDSNGVYRFYNRKRWNLDGMIGFKLINWEWTDSLLSLTYPGQNMDYLIGTSGIDYKVSYKIPYMGMSCHFKQAKFSSGISLLYSFLVFVDDHDYHKLRGLRGLRFIDTFRMGQYLGLSAYTRWNLSDTFSLGLSCDLDWVPELVGDVTILHEDGGVLGSRKGGAGVGYAAASASLSFGYHY